MLATNWTPTTTTTGRKRTSQFVMAAPAKKTRLEAAPQVSTDTRPPALPSVVAHPAPMTHDWYAFPYG
ncbi:hypothetical protein SDRG_16359 [Saprolegnia diclina VS20]|uniref:Uncharacterized protein n=1 Tax=Saprolegnia diclina (strain VS20) TaxID=1156394 RepID=T0PU34_SAPDV|nr:hypothetical protein SDRG_16359 [Saprolegnia diclina VS20]EQC25761.1 hypothetical protein SDRG_16359 [Saprolegnia diclina VS20]|eukprot:XP_008620786.1 hypothetical protein SDRG_16359 [Saprolegnia diclina VS20]